MIVSVAAIAKLKAFVAIPPSASVSWMVTLYTPAVDGVPETVPVLVPSPTPVGNVPEAIAQLYGVFPPDAVSVAL